MNISKKALMSFLMTLTSLIAMAQPYYHVMKQDGNKLTEEAMYDSKNYKIRVDMVPAEEKPKDAIGGKITIWRYDCNKSKLKRSFYFTKHGNVIYDNTKKKFYFDSQLGVIGWYGVYRFKDGMIGSNDICAHFRRGETIDECTKAYGGTFPISQSETDFYFANPDNLPKLQEDLGNERWGVLSYCEWNYVIEALGEAGWWVGNTRCYLIDTTPGKSLLAAIAKENKSKSMTWGQFYTYAAQGLVGLPLPGERKNDEVYGAGRYGSYWSCTPAGLSNSWGVGIDSNGAYLGTLYNGLGHAVRLVILAD